MPEALGKIAMTLTQWSDLAEDVPGELVDGVLEEEELPTFLHEAVVTWLLWQLRNWTEQHGGWVFPSEAKFAVGPQRGRKPDLSVYLPADTLPRQSESSTAHPPSVMIEVVSASPRDGRRDRVEKRGDYARFGVRWYWLVDPQLRTLEVFELGENGRYQVVLEVTAGQHPAPGCDGLLIDLDALWTEIDRLPVE